MGAIGEGLASQTVGQAIDMVQARFNNAQLYATDAYDKAVDFLEHLQQLADEVFSVSDITITTLDLTLDPGISAPRPESPDVTTVTIETPARPTVNAVTIGNIDNVPNFDVPALNLVFPETPAVETIGDVGSAPSISDAEIPTKPSYTLPTVPTLNEAIVPSPPSITIPIWDGVMPTDDLIPPVSSFSFVEVPYGSDLLTLLKDSLESSIQNGGTGLGEAVENAIWTREEERANIAAAEAKEQVANDWENRGFSLPDGVVTAAMLDIDLKLAADRATSSRDIAVKQAELALANQHFVIQQAISLEGQLISYTSQAAQRQLEASKAVVEMAVAVYNAQVAKYAASLEGYKAQAAVFESRIRAALATVEIYKAQIEGAKLTIDMDLAYVELYKAQIAGIDGLINMYRSEMEAAKVKSEVDRTRIEAFKAQVEAYAARVQLNVAQFNMYDAAIRGEATKASVYESQVKAYESRVRAAMTEAEVILQRAKIESELEKNKVEIYNADIEAFKSQVQAEAIRINSLVDVYKSQVSAYETDVKAESVILDSEIKVFQARVEQNMKTFELYMKQAEVNLNAFAHRNALRGEVVKGGAMVAAQLAASSMAGVQASAGVHGSGSAGVQESDQSIQSVSAQTIHYT